MRAYILGCILAAFFIVVVVVVSSASDLFCELVKMRNCVQPMLPFNGCFPISPFPTF